MALPRARQTMIMALTDEENAILQFMTSSKNSPDQHPDAHACRLKISLVLLDSPVQLPWDLHRHTLSVVAEWRQWPRPSVSVSMVVLEEHEAPCSAAHDEHSDAGRRA